MTHRLLCLSSSSLHKRLKHSSFENWKVPQAGFRRRDLSLVRAEAQMGSYDQRWQLRAARADESGNEEERSSSVASCLLSTPVFLNTHKLVYVPTLDESLLTSLPYSVITFQKHENHLSPTFTLECWTILLAGTYFSHLPGIWVHTGWWDFTVNRIDSEIILFDSLSWLFPACLARWSPLATTQNSGTLVTLCSHCLSHCFWVSSPLTHPFFWPPFHLKSWLEPHPAGPGDGGGFRGRIML